MEIPDVKKTWSNRISTVTIGATKEEGGTRTRTITVGGETALPFMHFEGEIPHRPVVGMEIWDIPPKGWPEVLAQPFSNVYDSPSRWAKKCVEEYGADLICLRLQGCDPTGEDRSPKEAAEVVREVLGAVSVPLIIWGCGDDDKDNEVFTECSQAAAGENCLLGTITQDNYRTLTALCKADNHKLIAESPVDINIAKQVNSLALDVGFDIKDMVIFPDSPALGYGTEYVYSIMERTRMAGLKGDKLMAQPIIANIGLNVWKVKEAKAREEEVPEWGDHTKRGPLWEAATAYTYLQAGADILVMIHPKAVEAAKRYIEQLTGSTADKEGK